MKQKMLVLVTVLMGIVTIVSGQEQRDYVSPAIGTLKYVPAGRFQRDDTAGNISVISNPYRISQHEITRVQFASIMGSDPSWDDYSSGTTDPVQNVNWYHAIAFCNKLSLSEGLDPVYEVDGVDYTVLTFDQIPMDYKKNWDNVTGNREANGYRLPTETEWMWAAMGAPADGQGEGINTTGYRKAFAGSTGNNAIKDYAVFKWNKGQTGRITTGKSNPAGSRQANELDLYDMSGNVWEWCQDWYDSYPAGTVTDYMGASVGTECTLRGGSWNSIASNWPLAYRKGSIPYIPYYFIGFRVVRR